MVWDWLGLLRRLLACGLGFVHAPIRRSRIGTIVERIALSLLAVMALGAAGWFLGSWFLSVGMEQQATGVRHSLWGLSP